jgi:drug/metabolite transporter (DMT)-like permease
MSAVVLVSVILAAVLHGGWNAIAKGIPDRLASSSLIGLSYLSVGGVGVLFVPGPSAASMSYVVASSVAQTVYLILLTASYKHGEFGQAYPLARGLSVIVVAWFSAVVLGEILTSAQYVGLALIVGGLLSLVLVPGNRFATPHNPRGVVFACLTGVTIATYTLIDGIGVRHSGSPLGYAMWLFVLQGILLPLTCLVLSPDRRRFPLNLRKHWLLGATGGIMSLVAYAIVVWAQNVAPLALVSALRETSVLLAGIIGFLFFKEKFSVVRLLITLVVVLGVATLQLG